MDEYFIKRRVYAMGLIVECPFDLPLSTCPLNDIRKLPLHERIANFKTMSDDEIGEIILYHEKCMKDREKGIC